MSGGGGFPRREGGKDGSRSAGDPRADQKRSVWRPRVTTGQAKYHQGNDEGANERRRRRITKEGGREGRVGVDRVPRRPIESAVWETHAIPEQGTSVRGDPDKRETCTRVKGLLTLCADHSVGCRDGQRGYHASTQSGDGRTGRNGGAYRGEREGTGWRGEGMRWGIELRRAGRRSARSGGCEPIATWGSTSHSRSASLDLGNHPREGGGGFPELKPTRGCASEGLTLVGPADRGESSRHHLRSSHFARSLRFTRRERQRRDPYGCQICIYREEQKLFMVGEGPWGLPTSVGSGAGTARKPSPVWQPGSQPGCRVLPVSWVRITPS
jgi:hypothetical protein